MGVSLDLEGKATAHNWFQVPPSSCSVLLLLFYSYQLGLNNFLKYAAELPEVVHIIRKLICIARL